jgi:hypothetical protein
MEIMQAFWREQVQAVTQRDGLVLTLPLMYPDGWQVTLHIRPLTPGWALLTDAGKTLGTLLENGMSLDAKHTAALLHERLQAFELKTDGAIISREIRLPLQGVDVQLFGEALVSIAHLIYRHEPTSQLENPAETAVRRIFEQRKLQPRRHAELKGRLLSTTRVDYLLDGRRPFALQIVNRREHLLDYMERWAFRWSDLKKHNHHLRAGMVYNPENQDWDATALRIGADVCDVFCRYDETGPLNRELDRLAG